MLCPMSTVCAVGAQRLGVRRIAHVGDGRLRVFDAVRKREVARRTPRAAIVEIQNIPAGSANRLREIKILLIARIAVQKNYDGMRPGPGGDIDDGIEQRAVTRKLHRHHRSGIGFVGSGIRRDGRRSLLRPSAGRQSNR